MLTLLKRHYHKKLACRELNAEEFNRLEAKHTVINDFYKKYNLPL
ncbi:hypothetical protein LC040_03385 [Bacillus tianshenii]|nr:hypothetical protein LC040_03385 [Bacillus tianshenii]